MMARRGPLVAAQAEGLSQEFWARLTKKTETDARDRISQVVRTVLCHHQRSLSTLDRCGHFHPRSSNMTC